MRTTHHGIQPIVVACSLDFDRDEYLVRQAGRLAQQLNLPVHLVHALEPFRYTHWSGTHASIDGQSDDASPPRNIFRKALAGLNELAELMRGAATVSEITANVLSGPPTDAIASEARAVHATMVVVGSADETKIFSGLSTTRELLDICQIPVLIINDDCITNFSGESLSILIADGLHENAMRPLKAATQLTSKSVHGRLIHAHVHDDHQSFIQRFLLSPFARILHGGMPANSEVPSVTSLLNRIKTRAKEAGAEQTMREDSYLPVVVAGEPQATLLDLADKFSADIVVFGKHRMMHLESMTLGRVSTNGMLSHRSAVMVVPA